MSISVNLNKFSELVTFDTVINQIPILISHGERTKQEFAQETKEQKGKDVMINWDFQDSFDTDNKLWVDANGLFMHQKELWKR